MSVIIAYKKNHTVYLACDSQSTAGDSITYGECDELVKIHKYKDYFFGSCGSARAGRVVAGHLSDLDELPRFDKDSLVKFYIPKLYKLLENFSKKENMDDGISFDNQFVLAKGDKCYIIDSDGVYPVTRFAIIGSGTPHVRPFVAAYSPKENLEEMMVNAITYCSKVHTYVSGKIHIADTASMKLKEVSDGISL